MLGEFGSRSDVFCVSGVTPLATLLMRLGCVVVLFIALGNLQVRGQAVPTTSFARVIGMADGIPN